MTANIGKNETLDVKTEADIIVARVRAKVLAEALGFDYMDQTRIATAVSELTRNALEHAGGGQINIAIINAVKKRGMEITVNDHGPGIENITRALRGGYSTKGGLGLGLSGTKKIMDSLVIQTVVGQGTVVIAKKWLPK